MIILKEPLYGQKYYTITREFNYYIEMPTLSVLVPIYNSGKYLSECLDSILNQTYSDFELILLNDGSIDNSNSICLKYKSLDSRIKYIKNKHQGIAISRNLLIAASTGSYSIFIDSDDWISPSMFNDMISCIEMYNLDILSEQIFTNISIGYEFKILDRLDAAKTFLTTTKITNSLCSKMVKTSLYKQFKIPEEIVYAEDLWMAWKIISTANKIGISHKSHYNYRRWSGSTTIQEFMPISIQSRTVWENIIRDCYDNWPNLTDLAICDSVINDVTMLYKAIKTNTGENELIRMFQQGVRSRIKYLYYPQRKLAMRWRIFGLITSYNYNWGKKLIEFQSKAKNWSVYRNN